MNLSNVCQQSILGFTEMYGYAIAYERSKVVNKVLPSMKETKTDLRIYSQGLDEKDILHPATLLSMVNNLPSKYPLGSTNTIPARSGVAVPLESGQTIKVINTHGSQVVDTWALAMNDDTYMSMCHTRASTLHLSPLPGDVLVTNHREPILEMLEDTTPTGIHDTLIAACDIYRYHGLGVPKDKYHENCADNFRQGLQNDISQSGTTRDFSTFKPSPPDPFNLFMNIPVQLRPVEGGSSISAGGPLSFDAPVCRPGDYVVLKALQDCIVVMSACPQDILKINNQDPKDAHFIVQEGPGMGN